MTFFPDLLDDLKPYRIHDRLQERGLRTVPWAHVLAEASGMTAEERNAGRPPLVPYSR